MIDWQAIEQFFDETDWMVDAACRDADTNLFFVDRGASITAARQLCADCPVRDTCLDYAIADNLPFGIYGGLTPKERRALNRPRAAT